MTAVGEPALRIGLIGTGGIAERFLAPALSRARGAALWSVLSRDRDRAADFARRHGARAPAPAHTALDAMLADPALDAVLIATPDALHAPQAIAAARAGKHVLVEKPMATDRAGAQAMIDACAAAGVRLGVAYHLRWHAGHRALVARLREGALGALRHARVQWTYTAPDADNWRAGTELGRWWALAAMGTHGVDLLAWALGPEAGAVVEVASVRANAVHGGPREETSVVGLRFASGATAELLVSVVFSSTPRFEVYGAAGAAVCEGTLGPHGAGTITLRGEPFAFTPQDPYQGEIEDFVAAVREGRDPEVSGLAGLRNVEVLLAAAPER